MAEENIVNMSLKNEYASYPVLFYKMLTCKKIVKPTRINFGNHKAQYFLYFEPTKKLSDKVILYIHGGGWNSGGPSMFKFIGQKFALSGYTCIVMGYRKAPSYHFKEQMEDICNGYKRVVDFLKEKKINNNKIIITGSSAGAHLGALLCYDKDLHQQYEMNIEHIAGYIGLGGPFYFNGKNTRTLWKLATVLFGKEKNWEIGEPFCKLSKGQKIQMLLIHSKRDEVVCDENSLNFYDKAVLCKIPATLYTVLPKADNHSSYSAGIFLEERDNCKTLDELLNWIEKI